MTGYRTVTLVLISCDTAHSRRRIRRCISHTTFEVCLTSIFRWSPATGFHKNCLDNTFEHCQSFWMGVYVTDTMFRKSIPLPSSGDLTTRDTFHICLILDIAHCLMHSPICFKRLETCVFWALSTTPARTCVCLCVCVCVRAYTFLSAYYIYKSRSGQRILNHIIETF